MLYAVVLGSEIPNLHYCNSTWKHVATKHKKILVFCRVFSWLNYKSYLTIITLCIVSQNGGSSKTLKKNLGTNSSIYKEIIMASIDVYIFYF